jgi:hypothetical protein
LADAGEVKAYPLESFNEEGILLRERRGRGRDMVRSLSITKRDLDRPAALVCTEKVAIGDD